MKITHSAKWILCVPMAVLAPVMSLAQTFTSGSTGSDGALSYTTPGIYVFDPTKFNPALDPAGDGIFNFTTITIAAGVTVRLTGSVLNVPVVWLAQGAVTIDGTIDLSGQDGFNATNTTQRTYTIPGAGGYGGGYPGIGSNSAGPGLGALGGVVNCRPTDGRIAGNGGFEGNQFLVPLVGGDGGGGHGPVAGGAGGGAILIASSSSISGAGSINANGGSSPNPTDAGFGGAGAGGGIRLVAPTVTLSGKLTASAGGNTVGCGGNNNGVVRIEGFTIGPIQASGSLYTATPYGLFLTVAEEPTLGVVSVGGFAVATTPTGNFTFPDVTVNSNTPLTVAIKASNVPLGTVATLTIFSENGPDQTITATPLAGTLASSTATASVTLPAGFSRGFLTAAYTQ